MPLQPNSTSFVPALSARHFYPRSHQHQQQHGSQGSHGRVPGPAGGSCQRPAEQPAEAQPGAGQEGREGPGHLHHHCEGPHHPGADPDQEGREGPDFLHHHRAGARHQRRRAEDPREGHHHGRVGPWHQGHDLWQRRGRAGPRHPGRHGRWRDGRQRTWCPGPRGSQRRNIGVDSLDREHKHRPPHAACLNHISSSQRAGIRLAVQGVLLPLQRALLLCVCVCVCVLPRSRGHTCCGLKRPSDHLGLLLRVDEGLCV